MPKLSINDQVAASMYQIIQSDYHKTLFAHSEAECLCKCEKCDDACLCKKDGSCAKKCKGCEKSDHKHTDDCGCMDNKFANLVGILNKASELQEQLGLNKSSEATINLIESMLKEAVEMLPYIASDDADEDFKGTKPELGNLEAIEDEPEDKALIEAYLADRSKSPQLKSEDIDKALGNSLHDPMLPPPDLDLTDKPQMDLGVGEDVDFEDELSLAAPKAAPDTEQEFLNWQKEREMPDWGQDFQEGGYEIPPELRRAPNALRSSRNQDTIPAIPSKMKDAAETQLDAFLAKYASDLDLEDVSVESSDPKRITEEDLLGDEEYDEYKFDKVLDQLKQDEEDELPDDLDEDDEEAELSRLMGKLDHFGEEDYQDESDIDKLIKDYHG